MDIYLGGTSVSLTVPLVDMQGNPLAPDSVDYRVINSKGVEVVPRTPLDTFAPGMSEADVTIPAEINQLTPLGNINLYGMAYNTREARTVELYCLISGNTVLLSQSYGLQPSDVLIVGVNSFQTYAQSELTALDIPNLPGWDAADERQRTAALIDARYHIVQLNFSLLNSNSNLDQTNINYVPDVRSIGRSDIFVFNGNLDLLTPNEYLTLPNKLQNVLRLSQVVEADYILGGQPVEGKRRAGLMESKAGESSQMFRPGKPLDLPVCRRAMSYLGYYVTFARRVTRS